jgi:type IV pilus assembly protein PilM
MANTNQSGPRLACEITPERIIAARATADGTAMDSFTARTLAAGAVTPRLAEDNIVNPDALKQAVTDALTTIGASSREIVAILPDASIRVALLEFDTLPEKKQDADGVIRFRLKKSLPFDVDRASLSYDVRRVNGKVNVVAAVVLGSVLAEYEQLFRDLGYSPGIVLPSTIASLRNIGTNEPVLVIKADSTTTTLAIVANEQLMLLRTLENQSGAAPSFDQLCHDVFSSLVFFQDTYNMRVERILVGGLLDAEAIGDTVEEQTGVAVQDLVRSSYSASTQPNFPVSALAGVAGALLG